MSQPANGNRPIVGNRAPRTINLAVARNARQPYASPGPMLLNGRVGTEKVEARNLAICEEACA
jgi:hypothetical protein